MDSSNLSSAPAGSSLLNGCNTALNATCADTLENNELLSSLYTYLPHSLLTLFLGVFTYWLVSHVVLDPPPPKGLKAIPKPRSTLPYLGRIHDVDRFAPWRAMKKFNDRYDGLFQCILGGENHIWVGREDIAYDLLCKNAAICSARGDLGAYPNVTTEGEYLPLLGYTDAFLRQRKFAHQITSRNVNNKFFNYIPLETKRYLHSLLTMDKGSDFHHLSHMFCGYITARLAYGSPESAAEHVKNAGWFIHQLGPGGPVTNLMPFLRHFPEWLVPDKKDVRLRREEEGKLWKSLFKKATKEYESGETPISYVATYLESNKIRLANGEKPLFIDEKEATYSVGMLCIVAIFTIGGPFIVFFVAMILHPEWQEKVRSEIDDVTGGNRLVELSDSPRLPMLRAALRECLRWKSTVPAGVPRFLEKDYSFEGYHFPKHSIVHVLDVALAGNPNRYPEPEKYNPDRWLNPSYPTFQAPLTEHPRLKGHHIFGSGRRACPGPDMVEAELLVVCGSLLAFFELKPALGEDGKPLWPDPEKWTTDVIGGPLPFDCNIQIRDEAKEKLVKAMYQEAFV